LAGSPTARLGTCGSEQAATIPVDGTGVAAFGSPGMGAGGRAQGGEEVRW